MGDLLLDRDLLLDLDEREYLLLLDDCCWGEDLKLKCDVRKGDLDLRLCKGGGDRE